jgi:hypothetical protein
MLQHEFLDNLERSARATKAAITKKGPRDLAPYVVAHRGEHPVGVVTIPKHDPALILQVAGFCANAFDADNIGIVFETYQSAHGPDESMWNINPMTGRMWVQGEMDEAVKHHDAIGKGWINEAVSLAVINRAGDYGMTVLPFKYVGNKYLHWLDEQGWSTKDDKVADATTGYFPETMRRFMTKPSLDHTMPAHLAHLDRDQRDLGAAQYLSAHGCAVHMYALATDEKRMRTMGQDGTTWVAQ